MVQSCPRCGRHSSDYAPVDPDIDHLTVILSCARQLLASEYPTASSISLETEKVDSLCPDEGRSEGPVTARPVGVGNNAENSPIEEDLVYFVAKVKKNGRATDGLGDKWETSFTYKFRGGPVHSGVAPRDLPLSFWREAESGRPITFQDSKVLTAAWMTLRQSQMELEANLDFLREQSAAGLTEYQRSTGRALQGELRGVEEVFTYLDPDGSIGAEMARSARLTS